jgi:hypothetical protein
VASTEPTETQQQTVRIEVEQSWQAPTLPAVSPPAEDSGAGVSPPAEDGAGVGTPPAEESGSVGAETPAAERVSGTVLLLADARTAFILINHARKRAIVNAFGVSPEQANAVTAIGLLLIANAAHDRVGRLLKGAGAPTSGDALIAGGAARALLGAIAGPAVDETPGLGTLIVLAVAARAAGPTAIRSLRGVRAGSHRATVGFRHRYGYLFDPGHRRARRAERRQARSRESSSKPSSPGA